MLNRYFVRQLLLAACSVVLTASYGLANIVISVEHELVLPGGIAQVGVFASSDMGNNISGFNLPLDINADGKRALPTGFTFNIVPLSNILFNNTSLDMPEPQITLANIDAIPSGFVQANQAVTLGAVPTKLFDLVINVGPNVPVGTVIPIHILRDSIGFFNVTSPNGGITSLPGVGTPSIGSITVVPEPGVLAQLGTIALIVASWFRVRPLTKMAGSWMRHGPRIYLTFASVANPAATCGRLHRPPSRMRLKLSTQTRVGRPEPMR